MFCEFNEPPPVAPSETIAPEGYSIRRSMFSVPLLACPAALCLLQLNCFVSTCADTAGTLLGEPAVARRWLPRSPGGIGWLAHPYFPPFDHMIATGRDATSERKPVPRSGCGICHTGRRMPVSAMIPAQSPRYVPQNSH